MRKWKLLLLKPRLTPIITGFVIAQCLLAVVGTKLEKIFTVDANLPQIFSGGHAYASYHAHHINDTEKIKKTVPKVVMIGGSVTREAVILDENFADKFNTLHGAPINFKNLGSSSQTLFEGISLLETMSLSKGSVVIFQMSFKRMQYSYIDLKSHFSKPKILFLDNTWLHKQLKLHDQLITKLTPKVLRYKLPLVKFYTGKKCKLYELLDRSSNCYSNTEITRHGYKTTRMTQKRKEIYVDDMFRVIRPKYLLNHNYSFNILENYLKRLKDKEINVILLEYPVDSTEFDVNNKIRANSDYINKVQKLAMFAEYYDLLQLSTLTNDDLRDSQHMLTTGKDKVTIKLMHILNKYIH
jgi:hypothetical protein